MEGEKDNLISPVMETGRIDWGLGVLGVFVGVVVLFCFVSLYSSILSIGTF